MSQIWIHCGLHGTQAHALQSFLRDAAPLLAAHNLLYPASGRLDVYGGGHHNIAWQLAHDRRFDPASGTLAALAGEIAASDRDVILSSEDFESLLDTPGRLAPLTDHPLLRDRAVRLVAYVCDQPSYFATVYRDLLVQGVADTCADLLDDLLARRVLRVREWRFQFDYMPMLRHLRERGRESVVLRDHRALPPGGLVADFLGLIGRPGLAAHAAVAAADPPGKLAAGLRLFCATRLGRPLDQMETTVLQLLCREQPDARPVLSTQQQQAVAAVFAQSNERLEAATGRSPPAIALAVRAADAGPRLERVFSFETQVAVVQAARLITALKEPSQFAASPAARLLAETAAAWRQG